MISRNISSPRVSADGKWFPPERNYTARGDLLWTCLSLFEARGGIPSGKRNVSTFHETFASSKFLICDSPSFTSFDEKAIFAKQSNNLQPLDFRIRKINATSTSRLYAYFPVNHVVTIVNLLENLHLFTSFFQIPQSSILRQNLLIMHLIKRRDRRRSTFRPTRARLYLF